MRTETVLMRVRDKLSAEFARVVRGLLVGVFLTVSAPAALAAEPPADDREVIDMSPDGPPTWRPRNLFAGASVLVGGYDHWYGDRIVDLIGLDIEEGHQRRAMVAL